MKTEQIWIYEPDFIARIDAPGALHHIIVREIERRKIFYDDLAQYNFLFGLRDISL